MRTLSVVLRDLRIHWSSMPNLGWLGRLGELLDEVSAITIHGGGQSVAEHRLREALDYLRRSIDGYDGYFEVAEDIASGTVEG